MQSANCKRQIDWEDRGTREGVPTSHGRWRVSSREKDLAFLALLQETSGNLHVFKNAQGCQVAMLGIAEGGFRIAEGRVRSEGRVKRKGIMRAAQKA
jgi:hypothetical protein